MMNSLERKRLNSYQKEAVLDESPACLVNANVGSGKTTVLTEKVRYLHEEGLVPYEKMMVLTFTNKAADGDLRSGWVLKNLCGDSAHSTV